MRAGIAVWLDRPLVELAGLASIAEESGFADLWVPDHYFLRDAYMAQVLMAEQTSRIGLGTAVAAVQLRHPALIASSAATLHELSQGRSLIGIGPGGFEFPTQLRMHPPSPMSLMRDAIAIIRGLLAGGVDHDGRSFAASHAKLGWQPSPIPILISGRGPRMLELAGETADGVIVHGFNPGFLEYVRAHVAHGADRGGRDASSCVITVMLDVEVAGTVAEAVDHLRPRCTIMAGGSYTDELISIYELDPDEVARLRTAVSAGDPAAGTLVSERMVHTFALGGPVSTIRDGLALLRDRGVDHVILKLGGTPSGTAEQIELLRPVIEEVGSAA
jgi:5,10-methylenetetrahydromethanopterin reductase